MRTLITTITLIIFMLIFTACSKSSDESDGGTKNSAPVAMAGVDQNIHTLSLVTLNGASSNDADRDTLTYSWSIASKPTASTATLSDVTVVNPTFTADVDGAYVFMLVVNDGSVDSASNTVTINAATANSAPVANAGVTQNINTTSVVTLNGSASSDVDAGDTITYAWSIVSVPKGSNVTALTNQDTVKPTFTADVDGGYVFSLIVNDGTVDSTNITTVTITATTANSAPIANAGVTQNINTTSVVTLNGSASSDVDAGDTITYAWSIVSVAPGSSVTALTNPTTVKPTFTADVDGAYVLSLVVNDGTVDSTNIATVTINAIRDLLYHIDSTTSLKWADLNQLSGKSVDSASLYCSNLVIGNEVNWGLPSISQLKSTIGDNNWEPAVKNGFRQISSYKYYWSWTSMGPNYYYMDYHNGGHTNTTTYDTNPYNVMCVSF